MNKQFNITPLAVNSAMALVLLTFSTLMAGHNMADMMDSVVPELLEHASDHRYLAIFISQVLKGAVFKMSTNCNQARDAVGLISDIFFYKASVYI